jgi:hypothetical protein
MWYYRDRNETIGPMSLDNLIAILINLPDVSNVLVWRDGFRQWRTADAVPELLVRLIDVVQCFPISKETNSEVSRFRALAEARTLTRDDRRYAIALCARLLRPSRSYIYPSIAGGSKKLGPARMNAFVSFACASVDWFAYLGGALWRLFLALLSLFLFLGLPFLVIYGLVIIIFRSAFDVELPNPLYWFSRHF